MRLLDVAEASGLERGRPGGGQTPRQVEQASPARSAASIMFGHGIARAGTIVRNVQYQLNRRQIEILVRNLDSPRSLENLTALSKAPQGSALFKQLFNELTRPDEGAQARLLGSVLPLTQQLPNLPYGGQ
jgi:hypothetical protein